MSSRALTVLTLLFCISCASVDVVAERSSLLERDRSWAEVAHAGNLDELWDYWAEGAVIYLDSEVEIRGLSRIRAFVLESRSRPGFEIEWEPEGAEVSKSGDLGYSWGVGRRAWLAEDGTPIEIREHTVSIWRKGQDGIWRCIVE